MPLEGSDSFAECTHVTHSGDMIIAIQGMEIEGKRGGKNLNNRT
jgi:hypothetical protein